MPENVPLPPRRSPFPLVSSLLMLIGFVLMGLFLGQLVGLAAALALTGFEADQAGTLLREPASVPGGWTALMLLQGGTSLGGFVLAPLLHWRFVEHRRGFDGAALQPALLLLAGLAVVASFPLNTWVFELNRHLVLPEGLQPLEDWIKQKETSTGELTKFLTRIGEPARLLVALVVVAVIPAVGEEITFRGVGQNLLYRAFGNVHAAVWVSAAVFSAIHLQFYGFVPRLLLGALFGYLYVWSGSLWVPIFAHFVNNGFQLLALYLFRTRLIETDLEKVESVPVPAALFSLFLTASLLLVLYRQRTSPRLPSA
jgi:membrane protease YdiL (CAAX protease family)